MKNKELLEEMKQYFGVPSIEDVAEKLGFKRATASTWRSRGVSKHAALKFATIKSSDHASNKNIKSLSMNKHAEDDFITLNYYEDIYAAAGYGAPNGDLLVPPEPIKMGANFLRTFFNVQSVKNLDIINVVGDSMEPFIKNGEKVIVERTHEASNNNIVIALVGTELYVKRLIKDPFGEWIKLTSENQYYEDIMIPQEKMHKLKIIGIVRGRVRPF